MSAPFYRLRYLRDGYILADAFRPIVGWGSQVFHVQAEGLPPHTDGDIIREARATAPAGYWLQSVEHFGGDPWQRLVFKQPVPARWPEVERTGAAHG